VNGLSRFLRRTKSIEFVFRCGRVGLMTIKCSRGRDRSFRFVYPNPRHTRITVPAEHPPAGYFIASSSKGSPVFKAARTFSFTFYQEFLKVFSPGDSCACQGIDKHPDQFSGRLVLRQSGANDDSACRWFCHSILYAANKALEVTPCWRAIRFKLFVHSFPLQNAQSPQRSLSGG